MEDACATFIVTDVEWFSSVLTQLRSKACARENAPACVSRDAKLITQSEVVESVKKGLPSEKVRTTHGSRVDCNVTSFAGFTVPRSSRRIEAAPSRAAAAHAQAARTCLLCAARIVEPTTGRRLGWIADLMYMYALHLQPE